MVNRIADDFSGIARRRDEIRTEKDVIDYITASYSGIWSDILDGFGSVVSLTRAVVDDGREPDMHTGLPMETDDEFRVRIKRALDENAA